MGKLKEKDVSALWWTGSFYFKKKSVCSLCMCTCSARVHDWVWGPEVVIGCLPLLLSNFLFSFILYLCVCTNVYIYIYSCSKGQKKMSDPLELQVVVSHWT